MRLPPIPLKNSGTQKTRKMADRSAQTTPDQRARKLPLGVTTFVWLGVTVVVFSFAFEGNQILRSPPSGIKTPEKSADRSGWA
jgi:hypothetical protein